MHSLLHPALAAQLVADRQSGSSARPSTRTSCRRSLLASLIAALLALTLGSASASAYEITWDDFARPDGSGPTYAPSSSDRIALQTQDRVAPRDRIEVVLRSAPHLTWRKGIEVDRRANVCGWFVCWDEDQFFRGTYTQDADHNQDGDRITLGVGDAINGSGAGRLRFGKAKAAGVFWNNEYELRWDPAHAVSGRRYTFTWLRD